MHFAIAGLAFQLPAAAAAPTTAPTSSTAAAIRQRTIGNRATFGRARRMPNAKHKLLVRTPFRPKHTVRVQFVVIAEPRHRHTPQILRPYAAHCQQQHHSHAPCGAKLTHQHSQPFIRGPAPAKQSNNIWKLDCFSFDPPGIPGVGYDRFKPFLCLN